MIPLILTDDQTIALDELKAFVMSTTGHMHLLEGAAGTGKTTIIGQFMEWVVAGHQFEKIGMCSPTHKALKVMKEMCPISARGAVKFATIHSILGLKHDVTHDGKEVFIRDPGNPTKFPFMDLVIVDESSMIDDQLFGEMTEQNYREMKVLFVGDSNQINPINQIMSVPMTPEKRTELNIGYSCLSKVVRQAEDNPIIRYSQDIIHDRFRYVNKTKAVGESGGVVMILSQETTIVTKLVTHYFTHTKFDEDASFCRIVAWRNVTVDKYNQMVRGIKYGLSAPRIVVGEKLLVEKPIKGTGKIVLFNVNEELTVDSIDVSSKKIYDGE